jgi:hypothetical protein
VSSFIYSLFSKIFDVLKSPKLLIWVALTSVLFLYIPVSIVPYSEYQNLKNQYGIWVLLILIGSISMLTIDAVIYLYNHVKKTSNLNRYKKKIRDRLESLSEHEKAILREFIIQDRSLIKLPIDNANVLSLVDADIIKLSRRLGEFHHGNSLGLFSIIETASQFISQELLGFPEEGPTPENIEKIQKLRPRFAVEIEHKDRIWNS